MIVLLDLNHTLVADSPRRGDPRPASFADRVAAERYRLTLVELVRPHHVILVTARPERHREATLAAIRARCGGWEPQEAYFNDASLPPPAAKARALGLHVFPRHGRDGRWYLAIE